MRSLRQIALCILCILPLHALQTGRIARKSPGRNPACDTGAICFSGRVVNGQEFRHAINASLDFVLAPGWTIAIVPRQVQDKCDEFASVVTGPQRAHRDLYIDTSYGWTAEDEMGSSPRTFSFVTNCADLAKESERLQIVLWGYGHTESEYNEALAKLGSSPLGKGRLWITGSKITHDGDTADDKTGKIEWMEFSVEIKIPK